MSRIAKPPLFLSYIAALGLSGAAMAILRPSTLTVFSLSVVGAAHLLLLNPLHKPIPYPRRIIRVPFSRVIFVAELLLIALAVWHFGVDFRNMDAALVLPGNEFPYLTNSGAVAHEAFIRTGLIPLWNPIIGFGEPLVDGAFSYLYNPFMAFPVLFGGAVQGGKIAIFLHIALMAYGAYALGWAMQMKTPGRLLLAFLLLGNGSMIGGLQHYQMGLSQAYVPWVLASLLWTIRRTERWAIGLLVVWTLLLLTAGTFWYVLPTMMSAVVLAAFHLVKQNPRRRSYRIDHALLRRLAWASALVLIVGAVRWLPFAVNQPLNFHPIPDNPDYAYPFGNILDLYFHSEPIEQSSPTIFYHFILPDLALLALIIGRALFINNAHTPHFRWQLFIPALVLVFWFTLWADASAPIITWLYDHSALIREWRFPTRVMAAGSLWVAVIAALCMDDIVRTGLVGARDNILRGLLGMVFIVAGIAVAITVTDNWKHRIQLARLDPRREELLTELHARTDEPLLMVDTALEFYRYLPFYTTLTRATFGSPDYRPFGASPTIGERGIVGRLPEYLVAPLYFRPNWIREQGYRVDDSYPLGKKLDLLWFSDTKLPYAFLVSEAVLDTQHTPLTRRRVLTIRDYHHAFDAITVQLENPLPDGVLVIRETNYVGWSVSVNGERAALESVDGLLAVRLPQTEAATIVFLYRPMIVFISSAITLLGVFVMIVYLLRVDRRPSRAVRIRAVLLTLWHAIFRQNPR